MPFYCGAELQASASFSARNNPQRIHRIHHCRTRCVLPHVTGQTCTGWDPRPATKDDSDRLKA
jgi:hypothetical protein